MQSSISILGKHQSQDSVRLLMLRPSLKLQVVAVVCKSGMKADDQVSDSDKNQHQLTCDKIVS